MAKNPLVGTPIRDEKRESDLVLWEVEKRYCRTSVLITNGTGADIDYVIGQLVEDATLGPSVKGAQPDFDDVLLLANITVPANSTREVPAHVRGPSLLNLDEVKRANDSETDNQLITRLAAMIAQGVRFVREPGIQSTPDLSA